MNRVIAAIVGLAFAAISFAGAGVAQAYGPSGPSLVLSTNVAHRGDAVTATVLRCPANVAVPFSFDSTSLGTAQTDATGETSLTFHVPLDAVIGLHQVFATCGGVSLSAALSVIASETAVTVPRSPLPFTGADIMRLLMVGFALLVVGAFAVIRTRRRESVR